ncbi:MAG TPA: hypothetical protein ENI27_00430, partial [bacterium]|nr:hypothetical protein [bacterium]
MAKRSGGVMRAACWIKDLPFNDTGNPDYPHSEPTVDEIATIIDRETTNKWIPCSEEMPRLYAEVDAAVAGEAYTYRVQYRPSPHNE